jgi:hypothetical protein
MRSISTNPSSRPDGLRSQFPTKKRRSIPPLNLRGKGLGCLSGMHILFNEVETSSRHKTRRRCCRNPATHTAATRSAPEAISNSEIMSYRGRAVTDRAQLQTISSHALSCLKLFKIYIHLSKYSRRSKEGQERPREGGMNGMGP